MNTILGPIFFALIAAIGNAMFAAGQKKAVGLENSLAFIVVALSLCVLLTAIITPFLGQPNYSGLIKENWMFLLLSGFGLFLTYFGVNVLYSTYGASSYILFAVLSIITTSVFVGAFLLKETFNVYHWLAFMSSIITVIFYAVGNSLTRI